MSMGHIDELDLTQIRLLAELSRSASVSRAAQRIGVSQSAASHALARLRKRMGDPLFARTPNGFRPTPYGDRLCKASCEAVDLLTASLKAGETFEPHTPTRVFRFLMNDVGQTVLIPRMIELLKSKAPGASARVLPVPLINPGAALSGGEVDFAVGFFDNLTTGFLRSTVFREHYVCIVRSAHPKFRTGMTVQAFRDAEHAIADATGMGYAVIDRFLGKHKVQRNVTLRLPGLHVLPMIVANSDLVAVVPSRLAQAFASRLPIKVLPPPVSMPQFDVCIHWHERYHHDPAIKWMRRAFVNLFASERR